MNEIEAIENALITVTMSEGITEYLDREEINAIVQALQEKAEREKGCEFCKGDVDGRDYLIGNGLEGIYIDGNGILASDDELYFTERQLKFCPMCGRKLKEDK